MTSLKIDLTSRKPKWVAMIVDLGERGVCQIFNRCIYDIGKSRLRSDRPRCLRILILHVDAQYMERATAPTKIPGGTLRIALPIFGELENDRRLMIVRPLDSASGESIAALQQNDHLLRAERSGEYAR